IGWMSKGQFLSLPMILIGLWMLWYAYEPDNGQLFIGWMSKGQFLSLPMILIGLWMLWYAYEPDNGQL
ncbi:hypothetical protein BUV99_13965, partial [Corynebacterium diphtheriae]